jgi:hypothetical protein
MYDCPGERFSHELEQAVRITKIESLEPELVNDQQRCAQVMRPPRVLQCINSLLMPLCTAFTPIGAFGAAR